MTGDVPREDTRALRVRWAQLPLTIALLALLFGWVLPSRIDYRSVWDAVSALAAGQVLTLAILGLAWTVVDSVVFTVVVPGLGVRTGYRVWLASTAVAAFAPSPVDLVVRFGMYARYGVGRTAAASGVVLSGILTTGIKLAAATAALGVLVATGAVTGVPLAVALGAFGLLVAASGLLAAALRSRSFTIVVARRLQRLHDATVARWFGRQPMVGLVERGLEFRSLARSTIARRWRVALAATLLSQALLFVTLLLSMRFVGVPAAVADWRDVLVAYGLGLAATLLPVLRSGLGASELIYLVVLDDPAVPTVGALIAAGAFTQRVFTWLVPVAIGCVVLVDWLRARRKR